MMWLCLSAPEHIESHGSFENYGCKKNFRKTKCQKKGNVFEKTAVVSLNDPHASEFLSVGLDRSFGFWSDRLFPR